MAVVKLFNLARMTTATIGTGTITLGSAVAPFLTFAQAGVADGDTVRYSIIDGTANSEAGTGVYTASGTTLTRTVLKSTNSNSAISLSGTAQVIITALAEDFALLAPLASPALTGNVTVGQPISNRAALNVGGVTGPGTGLTKKGNLTQLVCAPNDFNLRDLPPAAQYDGDVVISRGGLVFSSSLPTPFFNSRVGPLTFQMKGVENARVDTSGNWGFGTTTPAAQVDVATSSNAATRGLVSSQYSAGGEAALFGMRKARSGTSAVVSGDFIGALVAYPYDGSAYQLSSFAGFQANGTVASGSVPTDFVVYTGSSGSGTLRLTISSAGVATFANSVVVGSGATSALGGSVFVANASTAYLSIKSGSNPEVFLGSDASTYGIVGTVSNHSLGFRTNNTLKMTLNTSGDLSISSTTASTTTTTGALIVSGGFGVAGAINGGGALTVSGLVTASNATNATNTATGAIQTAGGLGVVQDIWGGGTLNIAGVAKVASGTTTPAGGSTNARLLFGTAASLGVYYGSGVPTVSATQGSIYLRTDGSSTSTRLYVNTTGSTTWTNVTTAA